MAYEYFYLFSNSKYSQKSALTITTYSIKSHINKPQIIRRIKKFIFILAGILN